MKGILIASIFILSLTAAQASKVDSLEQKLGKVQGKERVDVLNELYKEYRSSEPMKALNYTREAREILESINYQEGLGKSLNNLGVYYKNLGEYDKALGNYLQSLKIQEQLGDTERVGFTLSNIGIIYTIIHSSDKALEAFNSSYEIFKKLDRVDLQIKSLNNIGNVYFDRGEEDKALGIYLEAKKIMDDLGDQNSSFDILTNIGNTYYAKGDYDKALNYYFESLEIERENKNKFGQAHCLFNIGETYRSQGKFDISFKYLDQAALISKELKDKPLLTKIYASIAEVYFGTQRPILAYLILRRQNLIRDSLFNEESDKRIAQMEALYELDKKEKQNQILVKENENKALQNRNAQLVIFAFIFISMSLISVGILVLLKFRQNQQAKDLLEEQNLIIETKNQSITDSLYYAKSIQDAILDKSNVFKNLPNSFIFFKPKDIVSGDFYWYHHEENVDIIAVVDCTGHGVAGAFMTIMANSLLNLIIMENRVSDPGEILVQLDKKVVEALRQQEIKTINHGMDVSLCRINHNDHTITFAGARRPLYFIKNSEFQEIKGSKTGIADMLRNGSPKDYKEHSIPYSGGDIFYLASDGFADQFGGQDDKKYMTGNFKDFLVKNHQLTMEEQGQVLETEMDAWIAGKEQTDDILVIGFKL